MKILKISFKNINSLNIEETIDFTKQPFSDTGLFAIIGATGSGKSTLLDIISLALFNSTPRGGRLSRSIIESNGLILSRNSKECYAEIEYSAKGKMYRSKWSISLNRNGNFRDYEMEIASLPDNKIFDIKKSEVPSKNEEIIGLNYEQFVKSIVLSQGEFAKFLKSSKQERSRLLEKITGTQIYRKIGRAVFERFREEQKKLDILNIETQAVDIISEDIIENKKSEIDLLKIELEKSEHKLEKLNKQIQVKLDIQKLTKEKAEIDFNISKNNELFSNHKIAFEKLSKHKKLIIKQTEIFDINSKKSEQKNLQIKLKNLKDKISNLKDEITKKQKIESEKSTELEELTVKFNDFKEVYEKVINLDNKISELDKIYKEAFTELRKVEEEKQVINSEKTKLLKEKTNLKYNLEKTSQWLEKHTFLTNLKDEISVISEKISNLKKAENLLNSNLKDNENIDIYTKIISAKSILNQQNIVIELFENFNSKLQENESKTSFQVSDLEKIRKERELLLKKYQELDLIIKIQENHNQNILKIQNLDSENTKNKENIEVLNSEIPKFKNEIKISEVRIKELEQRLIRENLEAKYSDDRLKLKPNEKCFLCGSTEHPYVKNYSSNLQNTKVELQKEKDFLKKNTTSLNEKEKLLVRYTETYDNNNLQLQELNSKNDNLFSEFNTIVKENNLKISIENLNESKKLKEEILSEGKKLKEEIELLSKIQNIKQKLDKLNTTKQNIDELVVIQKDINYLIEKYSENNYENYDKKLEELKKLQTNFSEKENSKLEISNNIENLEIRLQELEKQLSKSEIEIKERTEKTSELIKNLKENKQIRFELFSDKNPKIEREKFENSIKISSKNISKIKEELSSLKTNLENSEETKFQYTSDIEEITNHIKTKTESLLPYLKDLNYESIESAKNDILEEKEAQKISEIKKAIEQTQIKLNQQVEDVQKNISQKKELDISEKSYGDLSEDLENFKQKISSNSKKIGSLQTEIENNDKQVQKLSKLLDTKKLQEKELNRWDLLRRYINADATGKNFSAFAQELTLIQLIKHANKHLKNFSGRYLFKKKQLAKITDEDLVVVDTFLGNSERSVITLSGGESFLASLSLALGLSDLAGGNSKLESLFIDEGFGSLDQEALDEALTTLEKLQHETNRTIGIISHVQALKERIGTRIELKPTSSGYSKIEISG